MNLEGRLHLSLELAQGHIRGAGLASERPVFAGRILEGRRSALAVASVALLFSLCGRAQTAALAAAVEVAQEREASAAVRCQRQAVVLAESAREHLWRLVVDLPQHVGGVPQVGALAVLRRIFEQSSVAVGGAEQWWAHPLQSASSVAWRQLADALDAYLSSAIFGQTLADWRARNHVAALNDWLAAKSSPVAEQLARLRARDFGEVSVPFLALAEVDSLQGAFARGSNFAKLPSLQGQPAETGPLARRHAEPLLRDWVAQRGRSAMARILARLVELADMPQRLRRLAAGEPDPALAQTRSASGGGLAAVETARGLLMHHVRMREDLIEELTIVAPTEWNFHPQGAWVQGMAGVECASREDALARGALLAYALDPCVAWELEVQHA